MLRTVEFPLGTFKFSAGHFTIFSKTEREAMHGHTYKVGASLTLDVKPLGLNFDYRAFKLAMRALCGKLNTVFLLPEQSEFLNLQQHAEHITVEFNSTTMQLLKSDVLLLPLANITIELLSGYLLDQLIETNAWLKTNGLSSLTVAVANTDMQAASAKVSF